MTSSELFTWKLQSASDSEVYSDSSSLFQQPTNLHLEGLVLTPLGRFGALASTLSPDPLRQSKQDNTMRYLDTKVASDASPASQQLTSVRERLVKEIRASSGKSKGKGKAPAGEGKVDEDVPEQPQE